MLAADSHAVVAPATRSHLIGVSAAEAHVRWSTGRSQSCRRRLRPYSCLPSGFCPASSQTTSTTLFPGLTGATRIGRVGFGSSASPRSDSSSTSCSRRSSTGFPRCTLFRVRSIRRRSVPSDCRGSLCRSSATHSSLRAQDSSERTSTGGFQGGSVRPVNRAPGITSSPRRSANVGSSSLCTPAKSTRECYSSQSRELHNRSGILFFEALLFGAWTAVTIKYFRTATSSCQAH